MSLRQLFPCLVSIVVFAFAAPGAPSQGLASELRELLVNIDSDFISDFSAEIQVTLPTNLDARNGTARGVIQLGGNQAGQYLLQHRVAIDPARFNPEDAYRSFDANGNFLLAYERTLGINLAGESWNVIHSDSIMTIDRQNRAVGSEKQGEKRLEVYPVGHSDPACLYYRYLLGMGRGYGQLLQSVESASIDEQGIAKAHARGVFFSEYLGDWELEIDCNADYLVRRASFTRDGNTSPDFSVQSMNQATEPAPFYREAIVSFGSDHVIKINSAQYKRAAEAAVRDEVQGLTAQDNPGNGKFRLMDFRRVNSDGVPEIRVVNQAP